MTLTLKELKQWRLWAQHLTEKPDAVSVAGDLCGIQAQYAANAVHALRIRSETVDMTALVKSWTLRGTLHLFPEKDLPLYLSAYKNDLFNTDYARWRFRHDCGISKDRMAFFADIVKGALSAKPVTRDELKVLCREHGMTEAEEPWVFDGWGGVIRMLAESGQLCVSAVENRAYVRCPDFSPMPTEHARLELLRRYIIHYGPVSLHDMMYFFRWTQRELKRLLTALPLKTLECDGNTYYYMAEPDALPALPCCVFLAGFDPLLLGYEKKESLFLPPAYMKQVFNNTGIVFPSLLLDGTVRGKWKDHDKFIALTAFENWNKTQAAAIQKTARALWPDKPLKME